MFLSIPGLIRTADCSGGAADHQFGLYGDLFAEAFRPVELVQNALRGDATHVGHGLADSGKAGIAERRYLDVVEPDDGNVFRNAQAKIFQGAHGADGRQVVERNQGRETLATGKQTLHYGIAQLWRRSILIELNGELRFDGDAYFLGDIDQTLPAFIGIRAERLATHEGDVAMSQ